MKCRLLLLSLFVFAGISAFPFNSAGDRTKFGTQSPYHTIYSHLFFLQEDSYHPELAAQTLFGNDLTEEEKQELSIKLKEILDGLGLFVNIDVLPKNEDFIDTATNKHIYTLFSSYPRIFLEKYEDQWLYSRVTVEQIPQMHREVYPFNTERIVEALPDFYQKDFGGIKLWQYIGILLLLVFSFILHRIFTFLLDGFIGNFFRKYRKTEVAHAYILPVARPISIFIIAWLLIAFVPSLKLSVEINQYVMTGLQIAVYVLIIITLYRMVDLFSASYEWFSKNSGTHLDNQLVPLIRKAVKLVIIVMGVLVILQNLDYNITALLAGISIGGLAFALAAQDTIKNLFGSILIFSDRPFKVGDWVNFDGKEGIVEEVGIRSTRVRTFYNSLIYVPNGRLSDMAIDNFGMREFRRYFTTLAITYDTPPELVKAFVEGLKKIVDNHPRTRKDFYEINFNHFGDHSLNIMFYIFFKVANWSEEMQARHEINLAVLKLGNTLGVRFAFPTYTTHIENMPGQNPLTPVYKSSEKDFKSKTEAFIAEWKSQNNPFGNELKKN